MGHQVNYTGSLKFKNILTDEQESFIITCQNDRENYDYFYALTLNKDKTALEYEDNDKVYPDYFYPSIKKFAEEFKKLGNDFEEGSYLVSYSEYGMSEGEDIFFYYRNGAFIDKNIKEILKEDTQNIRHMTEILNEYIQNNKL